MNHQTHLFSAYRWLNPMFGLAHSFQAQKATMSPVCHWTRIPPSSYRLTLKARPKQQPHPHPLQCSLFACPFSASSFLMRTCQPCHIMPSVLYNCLSHFVVAVFFVRPPPTVAALPTSKHRRAKWRWTQSQESWTPVQPSKCLKLLNKTEITMWKVGVKNARKGSNMIQYVPTLVDINLKHHLPLSIGMLFMQNKLSQKSAVILYPVLVYMWRLAEDLATVQTTGWEVWRIQNNSTYTEHKKPRDQWRPKMQLPKTSHSQKPLAGSLRVRFCLIWN